MSILEYSSEAENILNFFYRSDVILYVEGDDDVPFWQAVFDELSDATVEVLPVFGAAEVDKKISEILKNDLNVLAARDSDFIRIQGTHEKDPRILYTHGYAIENSLYHPRSLSEISFTWCRGKKSNHQDSKEWLENLLKNLEPLIEYDFANHLSNSGISVIPDNCTKFMKGQNSTEIDQSKVEGHIEKIAKTLSEQHLDLAKSIIQRSGELPRNLIRGHFLASLAQKHISENLKKSGRTPNISFEAIYASAIGTFKRLITKCDENNFYQAAVDNALIAARIKNSASN